MSGKSRHGKGKHQSHSKKSKAKQRYMAVGSPQGGITDTTQPTETVRTPAPASAPAPASKVKAIQYPYITSELRVIGILAGIIIVILIILALVLS